MDSAKLPHRETPSVRHMEGNGERTLVLGPWCTVSGPKRHLRHLQGRYPCGCLAKGPDFREKRLPSTHDRPDRRNPKFAEQGNLSLRPMEGPS